ncbi:hypothetical protein, partial [Flavobacterium sp. SaA2.13]|uniref:hypothetical protein n=1 Tax=Flavobacterium sp. SaA2.13 TaxID=2691898 RepID=UPI001CEF9185
ECLSLFDLWVHRTPEIPGVVKPKEQPWIQQLKAVVCRMPANSSAWIVERRAAAIRGDSPPLLLSNERSLTQTPALRA